MLGIAVISNTERRKAETLKDIDSALGSIALDPKLSERLRGSCSLPAVKFSGVGRKLSVSASGNAVTTPGMR